MKFKDLHKDLMDLEEFIHNVENDSKLSKKKKISHLESLKESIFKTAGEVFQASAEEMKYWDFCSIKVYRINYDKRLQQYLNEDDSAITNEAKFIESELSLLNSLLKGLKVTNYPPIITKALEKRIVFLEGKQNETSEEIELLDFSDSNANEKIVFLYKLGILEFLRTKTLFNSSQLKLAEVLSTFTGVKPETLQSYLNPIYSKGTKQKNNPLKNEELVQRVDKHLTNIGFIEK